MVQNTLKNRSKVRKITTNGTGFEQRVKSIHKCNIEFEDCYKFAVQPKDIHEAFVQPAILAQI